MCSFTSSTSHDTNNFPVGLTLFLIKKYRNHDRYPVTNRASGQLAGQTVNLLIFLNGARNSSASSQSFDSS